MLLKKFDDISKTKNSVVTTCTINGTYQHIVICNTDILKRLTLSLDGDHTTFEEMTSTKERLGSMCL